MRLIACFLFVGLVPGWCEQIPKTVAETLAGQAVVVPDSMKGHAAVVIVGFSKSSQDAVKEWDKSARKQLGATDVYQIAVLEDAPSFVRGMIKRAMKGSVPAERQSHFLVVVKGEADLKKAAGFAQADEPYVILLDGAGEIRWRTHGAVNDGAVQELAAKVKELR